MKTPYFDVTLGCNVVEYDNIVKASEALAVQLHEEAVADGEAIQEDMATRGYREYLINEARSILEDKGQSDVPKLKNHSMIVLVSSEHTEDA